MISVMIKILILISILVSNLYAFDENLLKVYIKEEMERSFIKKEVIIKDVKFIGFSPTETCTPKGLKIREIKRPSSIEFTFYCGNTQYRAIANYEILLTVYVSQRNLKRGDVITQEDIIEIKKPASRVPSGAILNREELIGRVIKRSICQGLILKEDHIHRGIPVKKGSIVNIFINVGKVTIMTEGVLKSDGTLGEIVKVQCLQTGKEIAGELIDKNKVRVLL